MSAELWLAASQGNLAKVKQFIDKGADINASTSGQTPLMGAIFNGHYDVVNFLIENGADVNTLDNNMTPLVIAINKDDLRIVKRLLEAGADVNPEITNSPLMYAIVKTNADMVEALLEAGARLDKPNQGGILPLEFVNMQLDHDRFMKPGQISKYERIAALLTPAAMVERMSRLAWKRRREAGTAWVAARAAQEEADYNDNENQDGGRRRRHSRRRRRRHSSSYKGIKKSYRRRH